MPPVVIAAGIGAAASIGGAALSASSQKKAANKAASTAQGVADSNNALQGQIYNNNVSLAEPWRAGGLQAFNATNALLGLGGSGAPAGTVSSAPGAPTGGNAMSGSYGPYSGMGGPGFDTESFYRGSGLHSPQNIASENYSPEMFGQPQPYADPASAQASPASQGAPNALAGQSPQMAAFQNFLNSDGYQFRLGQGMDAINKGYAANGTLQSGAAMKALTNYGQNQASSEFGKYLGYLTGQQQVGLGATNAVMGVGTNYANAVSGNNNNAGDAAANAALAKGNANSQMYSGIAGGIGNALGALGSSYGGGGGVTGTQYGSFNGIPLQHFGF